MEQKTLSPNCTVVRGLAGVVLPLVPVLALINSGQAAKAAMICLCNTHYRLKQAR
jgi:hypothetical protein